MRTLRARNRDRLRDWTVFVRAVVAAPAAFERVPAEGRGVVVIIIIRVVVVVSRSCSSSSVRLGVGGGVSRDAAVASVVDPPVALGGRGGPVVSHSSFWSFFFERSLVKNERTNAFFFPPSYLRTRFLVLGFRVTQRELEKRKKKLLENSGLLKRRRRIFVCILLQKTFEEEEEEERACVNDGGRGHRHERKRRTSSVGVGALHHNKRRRRRRRRL